MILMLTTFAGAADLAWSCPPITVAGDAHPWATPGDLGAINAGKAKVSYATSFVADACRVECGSGCYQGECTADDGSHVTYAEDQGGDGADCYYVGTTIVVTRASGDWTRLSVDYGESSCGGPRGSGYGGASWVVSWDGGLRSAAIGDDTRVVTPRPASPDASTRREARRQARGGSLVAVREAPRLDTVVTAPPNAPLRPRSKI